MSDNAKIEVVTKGSGFKGKDLSLYGKILAVILVLAGTIAKGLGVLPGITVSEILMVGTFCAGAFLPVDVSLWLEKFSPKQ